MMTVFKYRLAIADSNIVHGPIVRPLSVAIQRGTPCLWAVVDTRMPNAEHEVICVGTGCDMSDLSPNDYLNTIISADGGTVLHWFCREIQEGDSE